MGTYSFLRDLIGQIKLVASYSRFRLRTSVHFDQSHWSDLLENFCLPQVSTWFDPDKSTFTHARMLHPWSHSPHHVSHPLRDVWRRSLHLWTAQFRCIFETIVRLLHDPLYSSLPEIPHSHLPPKTSTRLQHCLAEEVRLQPTRVNHLRPTEVALCL